MHIIYCSTTHMVKHWSVVNLKYNFIREFRKKNYIVLLLKRPSKRKMLLTDYIYVQIQSNNENPNLNPHWAYVRTTAQALLLCGKAFVHQRDVYRSWWGNKKTAMIGLTSRPVHPRSSWACRRMWRTRRPSGGRQRALARTAPPLVRARRALARVARIGPALIHLERRAVLIQRS